MSRLTYQQSGDILDVTVRDSTGAKIESRRCKLSDPKETRRILTWLREKYGLASEMPAKNKDILDTDSSFLDF